MDLENIMHSEISQTGKDKYVISLRNLKTNTNEFIYKTNRLNRHRKQLWLPKRSGRMRGTD